MACRTSGMEKGLSSPSGAGAGLRRSETCRGRRVDELDALGAAELLGRLGLQAEEVDVHVAGFDVERRAVDEEGVVEESLRGGPGRVMRRLVGGLASSWRQDAAQAAPMPAPGRRMPPLSGGWGGPPCASALLVWRGALGGVRRCIRRRIRGCV